MRYPYPPGARTKFIAGAPQSSHLDVRPRFTFALVARGLLAGVSASLAVAVPSIASGRKIWKKSRPGLSNAHTGFTLAHSRWSTGAAMGWATWCASTVRPPNITLVPIDRGDPQAVLFAVAR